MVTYLLKARNHYVKSFKGLSLSSWLGIGVTLTISILIGVYYYLSIYLTSSLGLNLDKTGLILSSYGIGAILGGLAGGLLSDRFTAVHVIIGSLLLQGLAYFLLVKLSTVLALVCDIGMLGFASYAFLTANHAWVLAFSHNSEKQRLQVISILSMVSNLGLGVSALIISQSLYVGFHNIFTLTGLLFTTTACVLLVSARKSRDVHHTEYYKQSKKTHAFTNEPVNYKYIDLVITLTCLLLVGAVVAQFSSTYPIYIKATFPQLESKGPGILFAINAFVVVLFSVPVNHYFKEYNKVLVIGLGALLIGAGLGMLVLAHEFIFAAIACIIYTVGEIVFFNMVQLVCYQFGANTHKGRSLGIYRTVFAMSRILGPALGARAYTSFGGGLLWSICCVIGIISFLLCIISVSIHNRTNKLQSSLATD